MATTTRAQRFRPQTLADLQPASIAIDPKSTRWPIFLLIFGLFLTCRGYHAFDGDQAYRFPLLLHRQDPTLFATDPFVSAFDQFNPHQGYLAVLDWSSRPFGLATGVLALFTLTLLATTYGVDRLTRAVWSDSGAKVGVVALILVLLAKAGNIGTNHLFESTLLDRLIGFALGWIGFATAVSDPLRRGIGVGAVTLGLAALIHPSVGLQLALTLGASWGIWAILPRKTDVRWTQAVLAVGALSLGLFPAILLMAGQSGKLFQGLSSEEFRRLAVLIQGPQHMLPSTWRISQWLAWGCYPALAILSLWQSKRPWPASRVRFAMMFGVNLVSLGAAYVAVEVLGDLRVTVFQPFRMATLTRGLALVAIAGRLVELWDRGDLCSRGRVVLIGSGLCGDWMMVVATTVELSTTVVEASGLASRWVRFVGLAILGSGLVFLARHDTESGHWFLLGTLAALVLGQFIVVRLSLRWTRRRLALAIGLSWTVPLTALILGMSLKDPGSARWSAWLVERCRFSEIPTDDLERLGLWAREATPKSSRFIGPPGPKTFRLWSRRSVAFNRAGSPYHAEGLADWAERFREHVGFSGSTDEFARAYLADRHGLEAGYGRMTDSELAQLARSQNADHVLTASNRHSSSGPSPLVKLKTEGRYSVYRVQNDVEEEKPGTNRRKKFVGLPFQSNLND
jgi:hypothetical protein